MRHMRLPHLAISCSLAAFAVVAVYLSCFGLKLYRTSDVVAFGASPLLAVIGLFLGAVLALSPSRHLPVDAQETIRSCGRAAVVVGGAFLALELAFFAVVYFSF